MLDISVVVMLYILGAICVGYFVLNDIKEPDFRMNKDKRLGPSYWGLYTGHRLEEEALRTIVPPPASETREGARPALKDK
jgi:hypothetical protein